MPKDYTVGYGRPPKSTQFESGKSGNLKGRPKGSKNIATLFNQITMELIQVKENGKTKTMTRLEAVLLQMTNRALSGDPRTMREFVQFSRLFQDPENNEPDAKEPAEKDAAVMASLMRRMGRTPQPTDNTEVDVSDTEGNVRLDSLNDDEEGPNESDF